MDPIAVYREDRTYKVISRLIERGWTPLASMATILGYGSPVSIYQKQRTKPIDIIRVGGTNRVYEDTVIKLLEDKNTTHCQVILGIYRRIKGNG